MTVSILGLGAMGARMAARLLDAGHTVTVWNRTPERAAPLVAAGARVGASPRDAASGADIVVSMVTDDDASRAVWTGPEGALAGLATGAVAVESSTLSPAWTTDLAASVRDAGATFLDAPVAGSRPQADAGALIYLVGGDAEAVERVRPVFEVLGGAVHHVGPVGQGAAIKLAVNALYAVQVAAVAEQLAMLRAAGVDEARAAEVLGATPVASPAAVGAMGAIVARRFDPLFPIDLVEKDLRYAVAASRAGGAEAPVTEAARAVFGRAQEAGLGGDNITGVAQLGL